MNPITVRRPDFDFSQVPKDWYAGNLVASHTANALHLLFPSGEKFFIRSVQRFRKQIIDPALQEQIKHFTGQEAAHGRSHEASFEHLEGMGFEVRSYLDWYEGWAWGFLEKLGTPKMLLSATVALEHLTASLASNAFETASLDRTHPAMRRLLYWHAAEELEHRSVAFDVFTRVGGGYVTRMTGLVVSLSFLMLFWSVGVRHLIKQDPDLDRARVRTERRGARQLNGHGRTLWNAVRQYIRPGFHPSHITGDELAEIWLADNGFEVAA